MSDLDTALAHAFYQQSNTAPLIGFFVGEYFPLRQYRAAAALDRKSVV